MIRIHLGRDGGQLDFRFGKKSGRPGNSRLCLRHGFGQQLGPVSGSAKENPLGDHIHRPKLYMGFHEKPFRISVQFHDPGQVFGVLCHHPGTEGHQIRFDLKIPLQDVVFDRNQKASVIGCDHRRGFGIKSDKYHTLFPGLGVVVFQQSVCADIPVEHKDLGIRILFLYRQSILYGTLAADPRAVRILIVSRSHALNHHNGRKVGNPFLGKAIAQFHLGHHSIRFRVLIFGGNIFGRTGGNDDDPVFECARLGFIPHHHLGGKVALVPAKADNPGTGQYLNVFLGPGFSTQLFQIAADIVSFDGVVQSSRHAAQFGILFHQKNFKSLPAETQRRIHTGHSTADDQGLFVHRDEPLF